MEEYPVKFVNKGDGWWYVNINNISNTDVARTWVEVHSVDEVTLERTELVKQAPFALESGNSVFVRATTEALPEPFFCEIKLKLDGFTWVGMANKKPEDGVANDELVKDALVKILALPGMETTRNEAGGWYTNSQKWYAIHGPEQTDSEHTIGYGHAFTDAEELAFAGSTGAYINGITDAAAKTLLGNDVNLAIGYAKTHFGTSCWDKLDFWAKVLYAELVYNTGVGGALEYTKLKQSLIDENYGTEANDGDDGGTSWGEYHRNYEHPLTKAMVPVEGRHKFIRKHILENLTKFKKSTILTQGAVLAFAQESCVDLEDAGDKISKFQSEVSVPEPKSYEEVDVDETDDVTPEGTCKYRIGLYHGSRKHVMRNHKTITPFDEFEVSISDEYAVDDLTCKPFGIKKETTQCNRLPNEDDNTTVKVSFYDGAEPNGTIIRKYKVTTDVITVRWGKV